MCKLEHREQSWHSVRAAVPYMYEKESLWQGIAGDKREVERLLSGWGLSVKMRLTKNLISDKKGVL